MEDRIQAQHDWLGWGFGCLLWLQEHSNNRGLKWRAGSAPCTSCCGQGEFTDFEQNGKKKKTTQAMISGLTGPNQESPQEGPCDPTMGSLWCHCSFWIWNRNTTEFLTLHPKGNWRYKLRYPGVKEQQKRSWAHSSSSGNLLSGCTRAGTYW